MVLGQLDSQVQKDINSTLQCVQKSAPGGLQLIIWQVKQYVFQKQTQKKSFLTFNEAKISQHINTDGPA